MRFGLLRSLLGCAILLGATLQLSAADDDPIKVDLNSFKFKVAEEKASLFGTSDTEGRMFFYANGLGEATIKIPDDAEYEISVKASGEIAEKEYAKFKLTIDGTLVGKETQLKSEDAMVYKLTSKIKKGERKIGIEFTNDIYKENEYDRNLFVHEITLKKVK
jgi:hypothetical protein